MQLQATAITKWLPPNKSKGNSEMLIWKVFKWDTYVIPQVINFMNPKDYMLEPRHKREFLPAQIDLSVSNWPRTNFKSYIAIWYFGINYEYT